MENQGHMDLRDQVETPANPASTEDQDQSGLRDQKDCLAHRAHVHIVRRPEAIHLPHNHPVATVQRHRVVVVMQRLLRVAMGSQLWEEVTLIIKYLWLTVCLLCYSDVR